MSRPLLALAAGFLVAAAATGNGLPPPPVGKRFVTVEHVITAEKTYPDHDFYLVTGGTPKLVPLGPDAPVRVGPNRGRFGAGRVQFLAVPKGAAGKYPDAEAFAADLNAGKVPGQAASKETFGAMGTVDAGEKGERRTETHVVVRVDAKDGIVFRAAPEKGKAAPAPGKAAPEPPGPRGGGVVAGLAVALALGFAGLRLARRRA